MLAAVLSMFLSSGQVPAGVRAGPALSHVFLIVLENKDYDVPRGAGVYLGPSETASITAAPGASLKLFHLVVPKIPK